MGASILFSKMPQIFFFVFFPYLQSDYDIIFIHAESGYQFIRPIWVEGGSNIFIHAESHYPFIHWAKKSWGWYLVLTGRLLMKHRSNIMGCNSWPDSQFEHLEIVVRFIPNVSLSFSHFSIFKSLIPW
jgi:hypothetical protein